MEPDITVFKPRRFKEQQRVRYFSVKPLTAIVEFGPDIFYTSGLPILGFAEVHGFITQGRFISQGFGGGSIAMQVSVGGTLLKFKLNGPKRPGVTTINVGPGPQELTIPCSRHFDIIDPVPTVEMVLGQEAFLILTGDGANGWNCLLEGHQIND